MNNRIADIIIIGGGIVGLAHAYAAAQRNLKVVVFERNESAVGASVRNFGLIWPIGQLPGTMLNRALRSREMWQELTGKAGFWLNHSGSMHLAYHQDELAVLEEFVTMHRDNGYDFQLLSKQEVAEKSTVVNKKGLLGGLWSASELTVDPREAIRRIALYLEKQTSVRFEYSTAITQIEGSQAIAADGSIWQAEKIIVCSGADFEHLYPEFFNEIRMTKCKLQMMRTLPYKHLNIGPTLCAGLTLRHYDAFKHCPSLPLVSKRYDDEYPEFKEFGIHVLLAQNGSGELVIGDSHEYGLNPKPFDQEKINQIILNYLKSFVSIDNLEIAERWHGIYPKLFGETEIVHEIEPGVLIVNALGGAGMTLSFGLAEENFAGF